MKIADTIYRVDRVRGLIENRTTPLSGMKYIDGTVRTPHGIVEVMASDSGGYSRIDFVWRGRHYIRFFNGKSFSRRGLATVAGRYAKHIAETT